MLKHTRLVIGALILLAIVAMAVWPESLPVDVVAVQRGPMLVTVDEEGETRVRDRFVVSAPVAGRLSRIEFEPGDAVVKGKTVLARITPAEAPLLDARTRAELAAAVDAARATVGQAQAERDRARAALERATSTLARQEALAAAGAIARDALEGARTAVRTSEEALRAAEFTVARTEYELQLAQARLSQARGPAGQRLDITAPVDGVVLKRLRQSEGVVAAGEPVIEIGDPTRIEIVADLLSTDAVRVAPGAAVLIERWGGPHPLHARVRRVEPSGFTKVSALGVEEQRVNVIIDLNDRPRPLAIGDGYRVEVRIVVWQSPDTVKVPVGALFRRGDEWAVFVVDGGRARLQAVRLGERNDTEGQILEGLSTGQIVVLHPPDTLVDGMRITPRPPAT